VQLQYKIKQIEEDEVEGEEEEPQQGPPKKIVKNINGVKRQYFYQTTLKSVKELGEFRYKVMKKE
jgi:hypothetical protein